MDKKTELMHAFDGIKDHCGPAAKEDVKKLCEKQGIDYMMLFFAMVPPEQIDACLSICREVWAKWHTTNKFKVGDKVCVRPDRLGVCRYCIRATVTEVGTDGWGYRLRAFRQDLPGIFMFNMWDKDLFPRHGKQSMKICEDEAYCHHCDKDTPHLIVDSQHERDSSNNSRTCKVCGYRWSGMTGEYEPPEATK